MECPLYRYVFISSNVGPSPFLARLAALPTAVKNILKAHSVYLLRWAFRMPCPSLYKVTYVGCSFHGSSHGVVIIFNDEDDRVISKS